MKFIFKVSLALFLFSLLQVCSTQTKKIEKNQLSQDVFKKNKALAFSAEAGGSFEFETGSRLSIPANAFVDAEGKAIRGEVTLNFQEFHSAAEIIASGIKMTYDSAGKSYSFESGGMFHLSGSSDNQEVYLAPGKDIQVDLVSHKEGDYNFYRLKEAPEALAISAPFMSQARAQSVPWDSQNNWELLAKNLKPQINQARQEKLDSLDTLLPKAPSEPIAFQENDLAFDFDLDLKAFPELKAFEGIIWVYDPENGIPEADPRAQAWVFEEEWSNIQLEGLDTQALKYRLKLSNAQKQFETVIRPALSGKALEKAQEEFARKKAAYDQIKEEEKEKRAKIEAKRSLIASQGNFIRSFKIQEINVNYNWDKVYDGVPIMARFQVEGAPDLNQAVVYMLEGDMALEIPNQRQLNQPGAIYINPGRDNKFIAILPNEQVAVLSSQDFKNLYAENNKDMNLPLRLVKESINSVGSLHSLISRI